jgi:hypothetical protein
MLSQMMMQLGTQSEWIGLLLVGACVALVSAYPRS